MLRYTTDRARPDLVALYDIGPGNGVGQFLQPWSPHGTAGAIISHAKLQSNHHHQQTNIQFFTGRMPLLSLNQQCQSTEGKISHSMDLLTPSSSGVFQLCLWKLIAPGYLGEGCHAYHQPSDASTQKSKRECTVKNCKIYYVTKSNFFSGKLSCL